ncbi:hypothetical protein [Capnocytophaga sputigena]|uniref:hypothetical protein n=1 Tax=Capnocytophaga sputigena TaxID=1019 RepID=UPI0028D12FA5|nr:hypothetical protein [Capnocytophaga sputigena]
MKRLIVIIILLLFQCSFSQKYLVLEDLEKNYQVKHYTLRPHSFYEGKEIEMYNVFNHGVFFDYNYLTLISVLPDMDNANSWVEVSKEEVEKAVVKIEEVRRSNKNKFLNSFSLVKKEDDKYYKARCCLVEVFQLMDYSSKVHLNDSNIINTKQDFVTYAELRKELSKGKHITKYAQPMEDKESFLDSCFESIYLSGTEKRGKDTVYLFWTFTAWNNRSGLEAYHRGIDRFAYIEGKGIVAGSYDFLFDTQSSRHSHNSEPAIKKEVG